MQMEIGYLLIAFGFNDLYGRDFEMDLPPFLQASSLKASIQSAPG